MNSTGNLDSYLLALEEGYLPSNILPGKMPENEIYKNFNETVIFEWSPKPPKAKLFTKNCTFQGGTKIYTSIDKELWILFSGWVVSNTWKNREKLV